MIWAIVPVKPYRQAKQRLRGALSPNQRATLARALNIHTLDVLQSRAAGSRLEVVVVTAERMALELARRRGLHALHEVGGGLNAALRQARAYALAGGATATLVLPADLPHLSAADVAALVALAGDADLVIARSRDGAGTNALLTRPPHAVQYAFGPNSFREHVAQAETNGLRLAECTSPGLALDIDTPEDLADWLAIDATQVSEYDSMRRAIDALGVVAG